MDLELDKKSFLDREKKLSVATAYKTDTDRCSANTTDIYRICRRIFITVMSTVSLSPEVGWTYELQPKSLAAAKISRRRTVSTSFEQGGSTTKRKIIYDEAKKSHSYADHLTSLVLHEDDGDEEKNETQTSCSEKVPCLGIMLIIAGVTVFQAGSVLAKKMTVNPLLMLLIRDFFQLSVTSSFTIAGGENPFPAGKRWLIIARGSAAACQLTGHFYAVRYLPMSDVMMIASIKPVFTSLMAWIFLKEACGVFEILNMILVVSGIFFVVQPSFVFGDTGQQYDSHMIYTALGLLIANAIGSIIIVILRYLRSMHWADLAVTTRQSCNKDCSKILEERSIKSLL